MVSILTLTGIGGAMALALLLTLVISPGFAELEDRAAEGYRARALTALAEFAAMTEAMAREQANAGPDRSMRASFAHALVYRRVPHGGWASQHATAKGAPGLVERQVGIALDRLNLEVLLRSGHSARFYLPVGRNVMAVALAENAEGNDYVAVVRRLTSDHLSSLLGRPVTISPAVPINFDMHKRARWIDIVVPIGGADGRPVAAARFEVSREVVLLGRRVLLLAAAALVTTRSAPAVSRRASISATAA
jgi:hypothetical protein